MENGGILRFDYSAHLKMSLGPGSRNNIDTILDRIGSVRPAIVADPGCVEWGIVSKVVGASRRLDIAGVFSGVVPDPNISTVAAAVDVLRDSGADSVVAIGGGSAMDVAKAAATLIANGGDLRDYVGGAYGTDLLMRDPMPIIAVPTTAGTGSEVSQNAAISDSSTGVKLAIRSDRLRPRAQVLDPELLVTLPAHVAAHSGIDALSHALEGYCSKNANAFTDVLAIRALEIIFDSLEGFVSNRRDLALGSRMLLGSLMAGLVFGNTGTGNGHAIGRALGGKVSIPHGLAVGLVLPEVLEFNAAVRGEKLDSLARALGIEPHTWQGLADRLRSLMEAIGMRPGLRHAGVSRDEFDELAGVALSNVGPNPREASKEDVLELLNRAW